VLDEISHETFATLELETLVESVRSRFAQELREGLLQRAG